MSLVRRRSFISPLLIAIVAAVVLSSDRARPSHAQVAAGGTPDQVYVRDSAGAAEKFALAERMERLHEWNKAADVYQDVLTQFSDRVVPSTKSTAPAASAPSADASPAQPNNAAAHPDGASPASSPIAQYTSVISAVQERLARWPREGLDAYRARFEPQAKARLDACAAGDIAALDEVYAKYFITPSGKSAGLSLVDLALERGDFTSALQLAQRLLAVHPDLGTDRPALLFRAIVASHDAGDEATAKQTLDDLKSSAADTLGNVRGQDVRLVDAATQILAAPRPQFTIVNDGTESWTEAFGNASRSKVGSASAVASIGARIFAVELARQELSAPLNVRTTIERGIEQHDRPNGLMTGVFPVVDQGELFFQDNAFIYGVDLDSGAPLSGWSQTYSGDRNGRYAIGKTFATPRSQQETLALSGDALYAIAGASDIAALINSGQPPQSMHETRLICLDRQTGRERFVIRPAQLTGENVPAALKDLDFSGSPLIVGDRLYLTGRGGKGPQFEDCYVICLDAATGDYRWATYIVSASSTAAEMFNGEDPTSSTQSLSHLAFASGRVFCMSNLGAVAAVNAYDGSIDWLDLYPRNLPDAQQMMFNRGLNQPPSRAWALNPIIVSDGKVFALPSDGKELSIYDAGDGHRINHLPLSVRTRQIDTSKPYSPDVDETVHTIVGVQGNTLYLCGNRTVAAVDWTVPSAIAGRADSDEDADSGSNTAMSVNAVIQNSKSLLWFKQYDLGAGALPANSGKRKAAARAGAGNGNGKIVMGMDSTATPPAISRESTIAGRPFLTGESLFVPTAWRIDCISTKKAKIVWSYPKDRNLSDDEEAGNLLVTAQHMVIAGPHRVAVYTDLAVALRQLDDLVAAAPSDPVPRLRYAEIMFTGGQPAAAIAKLDEAINLMGGPGAMPAGANRQRVYADATLFAQRLMNSSAANANGNATTAPATQEANAANEVIDHLFDRAVAAASTPQQQVSVRLTRADFALRCGDLATQLRLHHEILAEPTWRAIQITRRDADSNSLAASFLPASQVARDAIDRIIKTDAGRALYQPYEERGAKQIDAQRAALDPAGVLETAARFPNARASADAAAWAADAFEAAGNYRQAVQTYRQLYFHSGNSDARLRLLESMARNDLQLPNRSDVAAARITLAVKGGAGDRNLSRPLRLPDGHSLDTSASLKEALDALRAQRSTSVQKSLPDLAIGKAEDGRKAPFVAGTPQVIQNISGIVTASAGFERNDRLVVTGNDGVTLEVLSPGNDKPIFRTTQLAQPVRGCAWCGGNLLAWNRSKLIMLDGESGQTVWQVETAKLPESQVVDTSAPIVINSGDAKPAPADPAPANADVPFGPEPRDLNQQLAAQRVRIREMQMRARMQVQQQVQQQQIIVGANGNAQVIIAGHQPDGVDVDGGADEAFVAVRPLSDRAIVTTNSGRVLALNIADGALLWQNGMSATAAAASNGDPAGAAATPMTRRMDATDDFIAIYSISNSVNAGLDEIVSTAKIDCFDSATGNLVYSHTFAADSAGNTNTLPINIALADDGLLVWVTVDRLVGKDLFESEDAPLRFGLTPLQGDESNSAYAIARTADSLIVDGGRILVLSDGGTLVREISPDDGTILISSDGTPRRRATNYHPGGNQPLPKLKLVDSELYIQTSGGVIAHDLNRDGVSWSSNETLANETRFTQLIVGRDSLLLAGMAIMPAGPTDAAGNPLPPGGGAVPIPQPLQPGQPAQPGVLRQRQLRPRRQVNGPTKLHLNSFSRARSPDGRESGFNEAKATPDLSAPLLSVAGVDGGIYYLTRDQKLCYLAGAATAGDGK